MAWMSQERKAVIAAKLKPLVPKGWKYSLAVSHGSTIVLTFREAPVDLIAALADDGYVKQQRYAGINDHYPRNAFLPSEEVIADLFESFVDALNEGNHNNSDIQSDYFDVGWYVRVNIGQWNKPFKVVA